MRIVSLCPSLTEIVFELDRADDLVAVTTYCIHPAEGVAKLEKVGGTKTPDLERVAELKPDVVLLNEEENRVEDARALEEMGLRCHSTFPKTVQGAADSVRAVGEAIEATAEAERLAGEIEQTAQQVVADAKQQTLVSFAYLIWRKPWASSRRPMMAMPKLG